jgi:Fe-S cluster biogenesis protein NfuA/nitrite reductase/ring-hydroxylating ferredoxin subunit
MGSQTDDIGERVESLLAQLARQGGKAAAATAEDLVKVLVDFYGSGLARIVEVLGAESDPVRALAEDPLVSSQLILHGLHPVDVDTRIERALDTVRPYLGSHAGGVAYLGIDDEGVAHLKLEGGCHGCPSSSLTVRMTIEEAVLEAAPELGGIEVDGQAERPEPLLQIGRGPGRPPSDPAPVWRHLSAREMPQPGAVSAITVDGQPLLVARLGESWYCYADRCAGCGAVLTGVDGALTGDTLTCLGCRLRYDLRHAGRAADGSGLHLVPIPLLDDVSGIRVAVSAVPVPV